MNSKTLILVSIASLVTIQLASAATIPAGTMLILKTTDTIYSRDVAGKQFQGHLIQSVGLKGHVVLPAGTSVRGVVKSPRVQVASSVRPLTLKLTSVMIGGQTMSIQTDPFEAKNETQWQTRRNVKVSGAAFLLPPGTVLQFRLSHELKM